MEQPEPAQAQLFAVLQCEKDLIIRAALSYSSGSSMRALFIITTVLGTLQAQEFTSSTSSPPVVRVHGEATVSAQSDQAQFDIGVVTQAASVRAALSS
jgi:uncharacterized protein YggE